MKKLNENVEENFNSALEKHISILKDKYKNIYGIFIYGSFARGDYNENSDIDVFLILDGCDKYHDFLVDKIYGIPITTEIIDINSFKNNIFDNRITQAKIILDKNNKLEEYKENIKNNFFSKENIQLRVNKRKNILTDMVNNYNNLNNLEKLLAIFTFIKVYSLIIMDKKEKIPSKKIEYQEVLDYLGEEKGKKNWKDLVCLGFKQEELLEKIEKISSIIFLISKKILKILEGQNTPFKSRVNQEYYNDFLESTKKYNSLLPIITWIEIIISKFIIFHTSENSLNFSDFTLDYSSVLNLKKDNHIQKQYNKIQKIIKNIDDKLFLKLKNNMEFLLSKI